MNQDGAGDTGEVKGTDSPLEAPEKGLLTPSCCPCETDLGLLASRTIRECVVFEATTFVLDCQSDKILILYNTLF